MRLPVMYTLMSFKLPQATSSSPHHIKYQLPKNKNDVHELEIMKETLRMSRHPHMFCLSHIFFIRWWRLVLCGGSRQSFSSSWGGLVVRCVGGCQRRSVNWRRTWKQMVSLWSASDPKRREWRSSRMGDSSRAVRICYKLGLYFSVVPNFSVLH